ncbi:MAG: hypothetical protein WCW52_05145 [Elusimicrobiales bacterium]|jgi:hypothetical protein
MNRAVKAVIFLGCVFSACAAPGYAETTLKRNWLFAYNGDGYTGVETHAVALDEDGNFYLGGQYGCPGTIPCYYVESRTPEDTYRWAYKYLTSIIYPSDQFTRGLAADKLGNIYAAGSMVTDNAGRDLFVQKFNRADGVLLWTRTLDGPARSNDEGYGVALDAAGDLIVAGAAGWVGRGMDAWVGKYDSAGNRLWELVLDGGANANDAAYGVCADAAGRIYAVGAFSTQGAGKQIWVAKYSSDGAPLAQAVYGGAGDDEATACAVGKDGTLFVSGAVAGPAAAATQTIRTHAWLRAYKVAADTELTELATVVDETNWSRANGLATAAMPSNQQIVYTVGEIAGSDETTTDAQIVRRVFDAGSASWKNRWDAIYNGRANLSDAAYGAAVDAHGNLVAAGFETVTDSTGTEVRVDWYRQYDAWMLAESSTAYKSQGLADGADGFYALYLDADNKLLYAAGTNYAKKTVTDASLQVFNTETGNYMGSWKGNTPGWDTPFSLQRDTSGYFYMSGMNGQTMWKIKTDNDSGKPNGMAWRSVYVRNPGMTNEYIYDSALLPDRTLITAGIGGRNGTFVDILVTKWDTKTCDSAPQESLCVPAVLWYDYVSSPGANTDAGLAIAVDKDGNSYIAGYIFTTAQNNNIWLAKYSPAGIRLWTREVDGLLHGIDAAYTIAFNPKNDGLYAAGYKTLSDYGADIWLARINKEDGTVLWETLWDGPGSQSDAALVVNFNLAGNPFVAGYSDRKNPSGKTVRDAAILKYDQDGKLIEAHTFGLPGASGVVIEDIQLDDRGNIYAAGVMNVPTRTNLDGWAAKFSFEPVVQPPAPAPGPPCALYTYPNPADPEVNPVTLHWELPWDAAVHLALYDQLGQIVKTWEYSLGAPGGRKGINETPWDGNNSSGARTRQGMYYLRMSADPLGCKEVSRIGIKR